MLTGGNRRSDGQTQGGGGFGGNAAEVIAQVSGHDERGVAAAAGARPAGVQSSSSKR